MKTVHFTDEEHRRTLALVRCQALIERTPEWDELLGLLEVDRPAANVVPIVRHADHADMAGCCPDCGWHHSRAGACTSCGAPVPLESRRADVDDPRKYGNAWVKAQRVERLEREGLDEAMRRVGGDR